MGSDLHMTRKNDWFDDAGMEIRIEEWLILVKADPELRLELENDPCFAVWSGPDAHECWLDYADRRSYSKKHLLSLLKKWYNWPKSSRSRFKVTTGKCI